MPDPEPVFQAWADRQRVPGRCRLTPDRRALIRARLKTFSADDLLALIRYAYEADTPSARFWRGDNDEGREYLGLENLFRASKIAGRVEAALAWLDGDDPDDPEGPEGHGSGVDLGPMAAFYRGTLGVGYDPKKAKKPKRQKPRGGTPKRRW